MSQPDFEEKDGRHVSRLYDAKTGILVLEIWTLPHSQNRDRADGPAYLERHHETGIITCEEWSSGGAQNRIDGPAVVRRDPITGHILHEGWWLDGRRHRIGGPSVVTYDNLSRNVVHELWCRDNKEHRVDDPAVIWRDADGTLMREEWWLEGGEERAEQHLPFAPNHLQTGMDRYGRQRLVMFGY